MQVHTFKHLGKNSSSLCLEELISASAAQCEVTSNSMYAVDTIMGDTC